MGKKQKILKKQPNSNYEKNACSNKECKIKKSGCMGSKNCPGYKSS